MSTFTHHLRVERSGTQTPATEVAKYFLSYLTLDYIDEQGRAPDIPFEASVDGNFVDVYWDYPFSFDEVKEMAEATLPGQLADMDNEEAEVIGAVWYDEVEIHWLPPPVE